METLTVNLQSETIEDLDKLVPKIFPSRSELIRSAVRTMLLYHRKFDEAAE